MCTNNPSYIFFDIIYGIFSCRSGFSFLIFTQSKLLVSLYDLWILFLVGVWKNFHKGTLPCYFILFSYMHLYITHTVIQGKGSGSTCFLVLPPWLLGCVNTFSYIGYCISQGCVILVGSPEKEMQQGVRKYVYRERFVTGNWFMKLWRLASPKPARWASRQEIGNSEGAEVLTQSKGNLLENSLFQVFPSFFFFPVANN